MKEFEVLTERDLVSISGGGDAAWYLAYSLAYIWYGSQNMFKDATYTEGA